MKQTKQPKRIKGWAVFNFKKQLCDVVLAREKITRAEVLIDELDYNWGRDGAYSLPCEIIIKEK